MPTFTFEDINCGRAPIERDVCIFIQEFLVLARVSQDPDQEDPRVRLESDRVSDASLVVEGLLVHQVQPSAALEISIDTRALLQKNLDSIYKLQ